MNSPLPCLSNTHHDELTWTAACISHIHGRVIIPRVRLKSGALLKVDMAHDWLVCVTLHPTTDGMLWQGRLARPELNQS